MACQRDANQNRDSRVATALMRRAPSASQHGYPRSNRSRTTRASAVDLGINSATDPEAGNVNEAPVSSKASKNWSEFSSGSVWNGYPSEAGRAPMDRQQRQRLDEETDGGRRAPNNSGRGSNEVRYLESNGLLRFGMELAQLVTAPYRAGYALRRATMGSEAEQMYNNCKHEASVLSRHMDMRCRKMYKYPDACIRTQNKNWRQTLRNCQSEYNESKAPMIAGTEANKIHAACIAGVKATEKWDYNNCNMKLNACIAKGLGSKGCDIPARGCNNKTYRQAQRDLQKCKTAYQKMNGSANFDRRAAMSKQLFDDIETEANKPCLSRAAATHKTNLSNCHTYNKKCVANKVQDCTAFLSGCNKRAKQQLEYDTYQCDRAYQTAMK